MVEVCICHRRYPCPGVPGQIPLFGEKDPLEALTEFCDAGADRFLSIEYSSMPSSWQVNIFLGRGFTCTAPVVVGSDRWLEVKASTYEEALRRAVSRLESVRPLVRAGV